MNRERAKELLPIIQAFAEGKKIEMALFDDDGAISEWSDAFSPTWSDDYIYRIKPEPKYRPFANTEECWDEMQKHQPFGWVENKNSHKRYVLASIDSDPAYSDCNVYIGENWRSLEYLFEKYTFADETPFGKLEE